MLPCVTATVESLTFSPMTMVPVFSSMTMRAGAVGFDFQFANLGSKPRSVSSLCGRVTSTVRKSFSAGDGFAILLAAYALMRVGDLHGSGKIRIAHLEGKLATAG